MKATVLIIDDDQEVTGTFTAWLQLEGYRVLSAPNGEAALGSVADADAVIVDAHMPILDGMAFLKRVRAANPDLPVAIVTGDYLMDEGTLRQFEELNAQVLFKPLWVDDLVSLAASLADAGHRRRVAC